MAQTIAFEPADRGFIGRAAVTDDLGRGRRAICRSWSDCPSGRGVLRAGQTVSTEAKGELLKAAVIHPLKHSIALAKFLWVCDLSGRHARKRYRGRIVQPNFVRFGKKVFE